MTEYSYMSWSISGGPILLGPPWPSVANPTMISGNGQVVFGYFYERNSPTDPVGGPIPARWDGATVTRMATLPQMYFPSPKFCSDDGSIIYTNDNPSIQGSNAPNIIRWMNGGSTVEYLTQLGHANALVADCTPDGSMAVGYIWDGTAYYNYTFYNAAIWTNGVPSLLNGSGLGALAISTDGSRILGSGYWPYGSGTVGYWQNGVWRQLTPYSPSGDWRSPGNPYTNRTMNIVVANADQNFITGGSPAHPIYWDSLDTSSVVSGTTYWGVIHDLAVPAGFSLPWITDVSDDGSVFVGYATQDNTQIILPIKWTNNVPTVLPTVSDLFPGVPPVPGVGWAYACSADGSIVWGDLGYTRIQYQIAYWDASNTLHLVPFPEPIPAQSPWMSLPWPYTTSISRDGRTIIASIQQESIRGWTVSSPTTSTDTGGVGDFWANNSYVDFSDPSVLAKFINPDGSWLPLGQKGELPTGTSPVFWHTVLPGNAPDSFLTGRGTPSDTWDIYLYGDNPVTGTPYPFQLTFDNCVPLPQTPPIPTQPVMMLL